MAGFLEEHGTNEELVVFQRVSLSGGHSESWLQEKLFQQASLIAMVEMFGQGDAFVPLCREFPLRHGTSNIFLDLLGVSPTGRLILIECKLWRNPSARREVIAQFRLQPSIGLTSTTTMQVWQKVALPAVLFVLGAPLRVRDGQSPHELALWFEGIAEQRFLFQTNRHVAVMDAAVFIAPLPDHDIDIDDIVHRAIQLMKLQRDNFYFYADPERKDVAPISIIIMTLSSVTTQTTMSWHLC